jgi:hypothetical protein
MFSLGIGIILIYLLIGGVALIGTIFWIVELIDIARRQFNDPVMKIVWLVVVFFTHFIGALVYFFIGKRDGVIPGQSQFGPYN